MPRSNGPIRQRFALEQHRNRQRLLGRSHQQIEQLEIRRLLSASVSLREGVLSIPGTNRADRVLVETAASSQLKVTLNAQESTYPASSVTSIVFLGRGGRDHFENRTDILVNAIGGPGSDTLIGGTGDDFLTGRTGNDELFGGDGNDTLRGESGSGDLLEGGRGDDELLGNSGEDFLDGSTGQDTLDAGDGDDHLRGGPENDLLIGGVGNDRLDGGEGQDTVATGGGVDSLINFTGDILDEAFAGWYL